MTGWWRALIFNALGLPVAGSAAADLLADLVSSPPSDGACWERTYSEDHLARHPRQKVTDIRFYLQNLQGAYEFDINIATREHAGDISGYCSPDPDGSVACLVACDGGEILLRRARTKGAILLEVGPLGRLHVNARCKGSDGADGFLIEAAPDDKLFLLNPTTARTCTVEPFKPYRDHRGRS